MWPFLGPNEQLISYLAWAHLESNPLAGPPASPVPDPDSKLVSLVMTPWLPVWKKCFRQFQKDLHILTWPLFFCLCKLLLNIFFKKTFHYTILWRNLHNLWTWCKSNPNDYWENTLECQSCVHPENVNVCVFSSFVQNYLIPAPGTK